MKIAKLLKRLLIVVIGTAIGLNVFIGYGNSTGAPSAYSNAPKDCGNCTSCHSDYSLYSKSSRIVLSGISGGYVPNDTFTMKLTFLKSSSVTKSHDYGFEIVALDSATKKNIGTIIKTDKTNTQLNSSIGCAGATRSYLTHTSSGNKAAAGKNWNFKWKAPSTSGNTVIFYAVVNSGNADGSTSGDTIFAQEFHFKSTVPLKAGFTCASKVCVGDSLTLKDTSWGTPSSWSWTFQNGSPATSSLQFPKVAFSSAGSDTITLSVKDANGKTSTASFVETINPLPVASISTSKTSMCNGDSSLLTSTKGSTYFWSTGSSDSSIYVKDSQSYSVQITNIYGCLNISNSVKVSIKPSPVVKLKPNENGKYCMGDTAILIASPSGLTTYNFYRNKSLLSSSNDTAHFIVSAATIANSDIFGVSGTNAYGCTASSPNISLKYAAPLNPKFSYNDNQGLVSFYDSTASVSSRSWNFGDGSANDTSKAPSHKFTKTGIFHVVLTVYNANACPDTIGKDVNITFTGIEQLLTSNNIIVYPNPSTDHLNIKINSSQNQKVSFILHDLAGRTFITETKELTSGNNTITLPTDYLAKGMYILEIQGKNEIRNFNIVKE